MTLDKNSSPTSYSGMPSSSASPSSSNNIQNSPSQSVNVVSPVKKNRSDVIKTIQEIAKVDEFTINQAIEACQDTEGRYSMDQVLNILMDENSIEQQNQEIQAVRNSLTKATTSTGLPSSSQNNDNKYQTNKSRGSGCGSPNERNNEYGSNSYDSGNPSLDIDEEEDDLDSCHNVQTNTSVNQFTGSVSNSTIKSSGSGLSELNMLREESKPVGLRNVGNTCWFNSIIQAFFHLPYLRGLVLSFSINDIDLNKLDENSKNVIQFVLELRKLFALMLKSKRKSINPNPTLRFLRNCSKYDSDLFNQEDVSEFSTILVNLIEESFDILAKLQEKSNLESVESSLTKDTDSTATGDVIIPIQIHSSLLLSSGSSTNLLDSSEKTKLLNAIQINQRIKNRKNPIVKLLNGDLLIHRIKSDEDVATSLIEIFREVNIQMLNARSLHAGLELEWGETSIDKLITSRPQTDQQNDSQMKKSIYQQESWIVQLPTVLFVCLNRYKFVKATQSSSKITEPFEFEQHIYLDRYMYDNREIVKSKRKELQVLNAEFSRLQEKLQSIKTYKMSEESAASGKSYALDEVLKCTLSFLTADHSTSEVFSQIRRVNSDCESGSELDREAERLKVVKECLTSWIDKIEEKIRDLENCIKEVKNRIENIFNLDNLKRVKYDLHSVCIHEGNALSGHFWTYIWNPEQLKWYKFNDNEVTESSWEDLYTNAIGGTLPNKTSFEKTLQTSTPNDSSTDNTEISVENKRKVSTEIKSGHPSAYFLIYVKSDEPNLFQVTNSLDSDLVKLLAEDQDSLSTQVFNLRLKQLHRNCIETLRKSNQLISEANLTAANLINDQNNQTCIEHAKAFKDSIIDCFTISFEKIISNQNLNKPIGPVPPTITVASSGLEEALQNAVDIELAKYTQSSRDVLASLPDNDLRTQHILVYMNANNVSQQIRTIALYDLFRIQIFTENNLKLKLMQVLAQIKYNDYVLKALEKSTENSADNNSGGTFRAYEKWLNDYRDYRSIIAAFINAANFMESKKYEEAATFFCVAVEYNERITSNLQHKMKGMDHEFLLLNRRKCLKLWNQSVIRRFTVNTIETDALENRMPLNVLETGSIDAANSNQPLTQMEMTSLIELMISKFLPCFFRLGNPTSTVEDKAMIDEIRQDWLTVLDSSLPELQVFHDFMAKLFEDQFVNHFHSLNVNKTMLTSRYKEAIQHLKKIRIN